MKINELIEFLEEMADEAGDVEVLIATQPGWPLQTTVSAVTLVDGTVYLAEGVHPHSSPYAPRAAWEGGIAGRDFDLEEV